MNSKKIKVAVCVASTFFILACGAEKYLKGTGIDSQINTGLNSAGIDNKNIARGKDLLKTIQAYKDAVATMSLEDERVLGESVGVQLYSTPGFGEPVNSADLMLFMNSMTAVISENSGRPEIPYHVAVVKTDEKNAYALPGGYIFVTTGLIMSLQNEAQLAFVLGHEIAHISQKHTLNEMANSKGMGAIFNGLGGALSREAFGSNIDFFSDFVKDLGEKVGAHSFSKSQETDADKEGMQYMYDTGYDPKAMLGVLDILQAKSSQGSGDHATISDRRAAFEEKIQEFEDLNGLVTSTGRLQQVKQWIQNDQGW